MYYSEESFFSRNWKWIVGGVFSIILIIGIILLVRYLRKDDDDEEDVQGEIILKGAKLEASSITTGEASTTEGYQNREYYTNNDYTDMNKKIHFLVTFTPPPENMNKCEYIVIRRTLPEQDDASKSNVFDYKLINCSDPADQSSCERTDVYTRETDFITMHSDGTSGKQILTDGTTNEITPTNIFIEGSEAATPAPVKLMLYGDACGTSNIIGNNIFEVFYKIHSSHYAAGGSSQVTSETPMKDDKDLALAKSHDVTQDKYSMDLSSIQEEAIDFIDILSGTLDLDITNSAIIETEIKFYLGFKKRGDGALHFNKFIELDDANSNEGAILTAPIYNVSKDGDVRYPIAHYFNDVTGGPVCSFYDIKRFEPIGNTQPGGTSFKIKLVHPKTTNSTPVYLTHGITDSTGTSDFPFEDGKPNITNLTAANTLRYTTNQNNAKEFILIETPSVAQSEGSFKLCLKENFTKNGRWVICMNPKTVLKQKTNNDFPIKIYHSTHMFPSDYQYAVYSPYITNLDANNAMYNIYTLSNGPWSSKYASRLRFTGDIQGRLFNKDPAVFEKDDPSSDGSPFYSLLNDESIGVSTDDNEKFIFEKVDGDEPDVHYRLKTHEGKYLAMIDSVGDTVYANDDNNKKPQITNNMNDACIVKVLGYPTTAALRITNSEADNEKVQCMILFKANNGKYRNIRHFDETGNNKHIKAMGGKYVQIILKRVS